MSVKKDYYRVLGLSHDADHKEIRRAYLNLAKKYHPDAGEGSSAEKFRDVQDAYNLLRDSRKRREYDLSRGIGTRTAHPYVRTVRYSGRASHLDLRHVGRPEPVEFRSSYSENSVFEDDPWEQLLMFFFRNF
ncbi:MAG: J domain-containing protein [Acidobacteria bacterium]|nr:J domain-containing protein [Acidobacteriota bacterium]